MALHYFIDAYNVLHATGRWAGLPIDQQRLKLLEFIEMQRPTGSSRNSVTVVFDGFWSKFSGIKLSSTQVIFSGDDEADNVIKAKVDQMSNPKDAVVVTNDRGIQKWVKGAGARVLECEDFLRQASGGKPGKRSEKPDASTAAEINEELKRIWKLKP